MRQNKTNTVEPLHNRGHHWAQLAVLYREVSLLQRSICTQLCVAGTADSVLTREVSLSRSVLYREVHCTSLFGHLNTMTNR